MKKIATTLLLLEFGFSVAAQTITPMQLKQARRAAYGWMRDYNVAINFEGRSAYDTYLNLFESAAAPVWMDYFPLPDYPFDNPTITAAEYANLRTSSDLRYNVRYRLSNAEITKEEDLGGQIAYTFEFDEQVSFTQREAASASPVYYYPPLSRRMEVQLVYSISSRTMQAREIRLADGQEAVRPFVLLLTEEGPMTTTVENLQRDATTNSMALVRASFERSDFDPKFYSARFDTLRQAVNVHLAYGVGSLSTSFEHADRFSDLSSGASAFSIGAGYYRQLYLNGLKRFGLEAGLRFQSVNDHWGLDYTDAHSDVDPDGGPYLRLLDAKGYSETMKSSMLQVPVSLRFDYFVNPNRLSLFGRIGVAAGLSVARQLTAEADTWHARGYYDWLFDVTLDQEGIYDFGTFSNREFDGQETALNAFALEAVVGIGAAYYFDKFSAEFSVNYCPTLLQSLSADGDWHLSPTTDVWRSSTYDLKKFSTNLINFQLQINYHF